MFKRYYKTISNSWNSRDVNFYDKYLNIFNNYLHMVYTEIHFKVQKFFWLKKTILTILFYMVNLISN